MGGKTVTFKHSEGDVVRLKVGDSGNLVVRALISAQGATLYRVWDGADFVAEVGESEIENNNAHKREVGFKSKKNGDKEEIDGKISETTR